MVSSEEVSVENHKKEKSGHAIGTFVVALGVVILLLAAATVVFVTFAAVLRSDWIFVGIGVVAFVLLYVILSRVLRVAANQNKKPLG